MSDSYKEMYSDVEKQQSECGPKKAYKQNGEIPQQEDQDIASVIEERLAPNDPENE